MLERAHKYFRTHFNRAHNGLFTNPILIDKNVFPPYNERGYLLGYAACVRDEDSNAYLLHYTICSHLFLISKEFYN